MTSLEALQAVYERGEECQSCKFCYRATEKERLSGRRIVTEIYRGCGLIDSLQVRQVDPADCPGVEDELNKEKRNADEFS